MIRNYFAFFANVTGFLFSVYYNLQAVKLQFYGHNSAKLRESIVAALHESGTEWTDVSEPDTVVDYAQLVWGVASLNVPAPVPHDHFVILMILFWTCIITMIGFAQFSTAVSASIVGYIVIVMKVLLCAAPVSAIFTVLRTCSSASLHRPTLVSNLMDSVFWASYGLAIRDRFIALPSLIGMVFSALLLALALVMRKESPTPKQEDVNSTEGSTLHENEIGDAPSDVFLQQDTSGALHEIDGEKEADISGEDSIEEGSIHLQPEDENPGVTLQVDEEPTRPTRRPGLGAKLLSSRLLPQTYVSQSNSYRVIQHQHSVRVLQRQESVARLRALPTAGNTSSRSLQAPRTTKAGAMTKTKSTRF